MNMSGETESGRAFVRRLLVGQSPEKRALFAQAAELQRQADVNRQYASAAVRTFGESGRESCLRSESTHLAAAQRKNEQALRLIDQALAME
jgi:hypothetical protein